MWNQRLFCIEQWWKSCQGFNHNFCYESLLFTPFTFLCWSPSPPCDGVWRWHIREGVRFRRGHESRAPWVGKREKKHQNSLSPSLSFYYVGIGWESECLQARRRAFSGTWPRWHPDHQTTRPSERWEKPSCCSAALSVLFRYGSRADYDNIGTLSGSLRPQGDWWLLPLLGTTMQKPPNTSFPPVPLRIKMAITYCHYGGYFVAP